MPAIDYSSHINSTLPPPGATSAAPATQDDSGFSFDHLLHDVAEIVNPLQHLPVVSTLYRALTGDKINNFEKVAGDTLYGGPLGFVASVADLGFKVLTGKSVGDTVLAYAEELGGGGTAQLASNPPAITPASAISLPTPDVNALIDSMLKNGFGGELAQRAVDAYQRTLGLSASAAAQ